MQPSTSNGLDWPSWDIQPKPFKIWWAGHRPLRRGSKTGSASGPVEAQSHGAAGRIPLRELWEYVKAKEAEARRRDVCEGILQSLFGEPSGRTETDITYQFDDCSVVLWSSIGTKDMPSGGCVVVDYTPPSEPPRPVFKCVREDVSDKC